MSKNDEKKAPKTDPERMAAELRELADRIEKADLVRELQGQLIVLVPQAGNRMHEGVEVPSQLLPNGWFAFSGTFYEEDKNETGKRY